MSTSWRRCDRRRCAAPRLHEDPGNAVLLDVVVGDPAGRCRAQEKDAAARVAGDGAALRDERGAIGRHEPVVEAVLDDGVANRQRGMLAAHDHQPAVPRHVTANDLGPRLFVTHTASCAPPAITRSLMTARADAHPIQTGS